MRVLELQVRRQAPKQSAEQSGKINNLSVNVDHPEKGTSHREEGEKTRLGYVVCGIHHESKSGRAKVHRDLQDQNAEWRRGETRRNNRRWLS
jgi:hypothetical protein